MKPRLDATDSILRQTGVPSGWSVKSVGELAEVVGGGTPDRDQPDYWHNGHVPWITPTDLTANDAKYIARGAESITERGLAESNATLVPKGSIVITTRGTVGKTAIAEVPITCNQSCEILVPRAGETSAEFLYYLIGLGLSAFQRLSAGTTFLAITRRDLTRVRFAVPPRLSEQRAIEQVLDAIETTITKARVARAQAWRLKRAISQRLLSHGARDERRKKTVVGYIPKSWDVVSVREVVSSFQYGLSVPMSTAGRLPILRMGNIQNGEVRFDDLKYVSLPEPTIAPYLLRRGDVLFNRTNAQEWVGKVGICRSDTEAVFASYLIRLIHDPDRIDPYYLGHVLSSHEAQCRIKRYATPGVQQVNINATNLGKVLIPVPTGKDGLDEQREIATILEDAHSVATAYEPLVDFQGKLRLALTHDLLMGRVRLGRESVAQVAS